MPKTAVQQIMLGTVTKTEKAAAQTLRLIREAGADVRKIMEMLGPRMKLWHINDRGTRPGEKPAMTPILKSDSMELGYGNMDLDALSETALQNGIDAVILESHRNWAEGSPLKSLQMSAEYLRRFR